jgi:ElaB/YqjD/DUF883 family membrane-anchored ribosome-binding protein
MSESTASSFQNAADTSVDELKSLIREAELALSNAGDMASDELDSLRERLRGAIAGSREKMRDFADSARRQAARADELVHNYPYPSIAIAAGVGVVAGCLIARSWSNGR